MKRHELVLGASVAFVAVAQQSAGQDPARSRQTAIVTGAARLAPAVVSVNVLRRERRLAQDPFDLFFMPRGAEQVVEGYGSGFIISPDGVVITNQHVTQGAEQIVVTTREGRDFPAKILGEDPLTDIAVLKLDGAGLPTAPLGRSTDLLIGEWVVAVGNPFAYLLGNTEPTVTAGRGERRRPQPPALRRTVRDLRRHDPDRRVAAGDVLLSARGRRLREFLDWEAVLLDTGPGDTLTVGYLRAGDNRTARLAVAELPTTLAEKVAILGGMKVVTVTAAVRAERNIQADHGALIYDIPDEMEQATGLCSGDVILQINRVRVSSAADLRRAFAAVAGGGAVTVWFERIGRLGRTAFYVR
jgi:S1-C subfamily serine protease